MLRVPISILIILALGLAGCATLSTDECSTGDWQKIGKQDGNDGRTPDRFIHHAKACKLDRSDASRALYASGRQEGLKSYCTTVRGYREGALGQAYANVCAGSSAADFMKGYQLGQRVFQTESKSSTTLDSYHTVTRKLLRAETEGERAQLLKEQARLEAENARLKQEIQALRTQADAMVTSSRKKKNL
ncbi:MAG: DUF2799 domain-containing protein [Hyphomicrobiaceae bacterium]|nr:DUF2799 domain-containing protein [Hyphomicrobiaceae bacterium]